MDQPHIHLDPTTPLFVFGGPYSNMRATLALRERAAALGIGPHNVVCTGDVVAYGAEPAETVAMIRDWGCHVIRGNCEEQLAAGAADCGCNFAPGSSCENLSRGWYPYAAARISAGDQAWMGGLPPMLRFRYGDLDLLALHGSLDETAGWIFASETERLAGQLARSGADIVLAGHAGLPFISRVGRRVWFNTGAAGMPANDGTPDIWYGLIMPQGDGSVVLSTHRCTYDHAAAAAAMRRSGHANPYARTMVTGLWPSLDVLPEAERAETGVRLRRRTVRLAPARRRMTPEPQAVAAL